jgi:glycerol-3-phosphate dehydrogenase
MTGQHTMSRQHSLAQVQQRSKPWDMVVIGGGATGVGVALDAASRGLDVVLVEQADFGKGTSSRSTKLVHGGVRYLRQGNLTLVRDALRERSLLRENAPHLVADLPFLIPCRSLWQRFFYGVGLKVYDLLATGNRFGRSHGVSSDTATTLVPAIKSAGLRGGVIYHDGQFDDARLLISMARTASDQGACLLNYASATALTKDSRGNISGAQILDHETDRSYALPARCVINAAGPFCDSLRRLDQPDAAPMIAASQGIHLVLPGQLFPGNVAMIVPKTSDGRVIFIIPWHEHAIIGTTDTPLADVSLEPSPQADEIHFLLDTASEYLSRPVQLSDVCSVFTGIRPLVKDDRSARTASLSRDHVIRISDSGLITIAGGKWTTVRKMSEDCVDRAVAACGLEAKPCITKSLKLHGCDAAADTGDPFRVYGTDSQAIKQLEAETPLLAESLHPALALRGSQVVWAVRQEMARTIDDVLSRRTRSLVLNAQAAVDVAPQVARLIGSELQRDASWEESQIEAFNEIARHYLPPSAL